MMNKYRGKIVQEDYIMRNIFHEKGGGGEEERERGIGRERKFRLFERGGVTKREKYPRIRDLLIIISIIFLKNAIKHHNNCCQTY